MTTRLRVSAAVLLMAFGVAAPAWADETTEALALFNEYVTRSDRFDTTLAELYADDATIKAKRVGPDGRSQAMTLTGVQWKALIRQLMPLAQQRGDRDTFRDVSAKPDGAGVTITAKRYSHVKDYTSPWAILATQHHPDGGRSVSRSLRPGLSSGGQALSAIATDVAEQPDVGKRLPLVCLFEERLPKFHLARGPPVIRLCSVGTSRPKTPMRVVAVALAGGLVSPLVRVVNLSDPTRVRQQLRFMHQSK